ncbi:MAG TPA: adenylate/guanylate cyclase domain-containing protein [Solirubrobacteraceae bacterium]|nr:adenylate/guanylate cyclase domain-containing protein [Solirubrobacteraceae bacterium]
MPPETRYARSGDVHIAYQVVGEGPIDILWVPTWIWQVEHMWEDPYTTRLLESVASFSRLIMFDRRGLGLSDPRPGGGAATLEEQMDDLVAVMDAVGSEEAAVVAMLDAGAMASLFAATHPERTRALVLFEAQASMSWAPDYDWPMTTEEREAFIEHLRGSWGSGERVLRVTAGSDAELRRWAGRLERLAASPGTAVATSRMNGQTDVRPVLPSIQAPTLVLHRPENTFVDNRHASYLVEHIPGARSVALPGRHTLPFGPGQDEFVEEIEEFLTGARGTKEPDRVLATVMFGDIVDSTQRASELGDRRWRQLLESFTQAYDRELHRFRGHTVKALGDGVLATFDGPARAILCAAALRDLARSEFRLELRAGMHAGEVEVIGDDIGGIAVHIAARILGAAGPGELVVSGTVKDLVVGSGIEFEDRGEHELRGVPGPWHLWKVQD